jgi:hypothetical protein
MRQFYSWLAGTNGTIVQIRLLPGIGGESTTAGRRFPISGALNPSVRSTRTIVPGAGCATTVMRDPANTRRVANSWTRCLAWLFAPSSRSPAAPTIQGWLGIGRSPARPSTRRWRRAVQGLLAGLTGRPRHAVTPGRAQQRLAARSAACVSGRQFLFDERMQDRRPPQVPVPVVSPFSKV